MGTVLASAADERYGFHLLSMIGSVQRTSDIFDRIVVHDLGLSPLQRRLLDAIEGVDVREIPPFVPHWAQGFTWKPWIWTHVDADRIFYLDAGSTVLRRLDGVLAQIDERGYFVVSQGFPVEAIMPQDYFDLYGLDRAAAKRDHVAAGIIGFATRGRFWENVILPTYEDCVAGRSLGFSEAEVDKLNYGLGRMSEVVVRDAKLFRHDQTILNAHFLKAYPDAQINDVYEFGGWLSRDQHPRQVIWNHRRRGDYAYLARARYSWRSIPTARYVGTKLRFGLWRSRNRRFLQPSAYLRKARSLLVDRDARAA
jgi:hypothetical protein